MAAKKLPPLVVFLMVLAVLGVAAAALRPVVVEIRLAWKLRSPDESEWKPAAEALIEYGSRWGLGRAIETALIRDPEGFGAWQTKLFERRPRDVRWALPAYEAGLCHEAAAVRTAAINALLDPAWRRPETVPVVAGALVSAYPVLRWQAGYVLRGMGPGARAAVPALIQAARDPGEDVRWAAVYALGAMAPVAQEAVLVLIQALRDPSVLVAAHAADALGGFGPRAAAAVPALIEAFGASDVLLRVHAAGALGALGRPAREALHLILEALETDEDWVHESFVYTEGGGLPDRPPVSRDGHFGLHNGRIDLLEAALRLGAEAGELLPCLSKLMRDADHATRQVAAQALARIGPAAAAAIPDLIKNLADRQPERRWSPPDDSEINHAAAEALAAMGPAAVPALVEALRSSDPRARCGAAWALGKIEPPAAQALEALRSALHDPRSKVRIAAARSLERLQPTTDVLRALFHAAGGDADRFNEMASHLESLDGLTGEEALPSLSFLREILAKGAPGSADAAVRLLGSMADEVPEVLADLFAATESPGRPLRLTALNALGGLASRAGEVVPRLIAVLERDPDPAVRRVAAGSLGRMGPRAEPALPALWAGYAGEENTEEKRRRWLHAIFTISPGDPRAIEVRLREPVWDWEISAALDLVVKAPARSLIPAVERHLEHEDLGVRVKAARALWALDRRVQPALSIAREALADDWQSGWWTPIPVRPCLALWSEWRNPVREDAARLLSDMGPAGKPAVPGLAACLDFPGHTVRVLAAGALWRVAGDLRSDILLEAVEDSLPNLSSDPARIEDYTREALRVLGEMGSAARGAVPALERLRAAAAPGPLREAADEALRKVEGART